jgi:sarcosine oxidase delta subunit
MENNQVLRNDTASLWNHSLNCRAFLKATRMASVKTVEAMSSTRIELMASPSANDPTKKVVYIRYRRGFQKVFALNPALEDTVLVPN